MTDAAKLRSVLDELQTAFASYETPIQEVVAPAFRRLSERTVSVIHSIEQNVAGKKLSHNLSAGVATAMDDLDLAFVTMAVIEDAPDEELADAVALGGQARRL